MSNDEGTDSLAAQAAAWVPPWERPPREPDRAYQAAAEEAARAEAEAGRSEDEPAADDVDETAEGSGYSAPVGQGSAEQEEGVAGEPVEDLPGSVDAPHGAEPVGEPTDVRVGPELPLPDAIEQAADAPAADEGGTPVDAPLPPDGDDAGGVFDTAAADDVSDDAEVDLPFTEEVPDEDEPVEDGEPDPQEEPAPDTSPADQEPPAEDEPVAHGASAESEAVAHGEQTAGNEAVALDERTAAAEPTAADEPPVRVEPTAVDGRPVRDEPTTADGRAVRDEPTAADGRAVKGERTAADGWAVKGEDEPTAADGWAVDDEPDSAGDETVAVDEAVPLDEPVAPVVEATAIAAAAAGSRGGAAEGPAAVPAQVRSTVNGHDAVEDAAGRTDEELPGLVDDAEFAAALEAILLVVDEPVAEMQLAQILEQPTERVAAMLEDISARYTAAGHGFDLRRAAGGWRLYTRPEYAPYVERFVLDGQSVRLTQAALETLAVVAYKQPVTRSRISAIRGVNCDGVMRTLVTRGLIEECGTEGETGAYLYRTTPLFLEKLGLNSVDQLPPLAPFLPDDVEEVLDASG